MKNRDEKSRPVTTLTITKDISVEFRDVVFTMRRSKKLNSKEFTYSDALEELIDNYRGGMK